MSRVSVTLVGVLNVTPDSFSDGGEFATAEFALRHGDKLLEEGADFIDIGGDSTRPGSVCCGPEKEWERIEPFLRLRHEGVKLSVDTHHASVADRALAAGVSMVNDVSAAQDPAMFGVVKKHEAILVMMYSRCIAPHEFGPAPEGDLIANVRAFFEQRLEAALKAGLTHQQIILDPGMGAFLHTEHGASIEMLNRLNELMDFGLPIMLGISRKGFLKKERERSIKDRDAQSVKHAMQVIQSLDAHDKFVNLYLRVHNVRAHAEALKVLAALR